MASGSRLPDVDRLSVLVATILLAYASARYINLPSRDLGLQLPGFYLELQLTTHTVVGLLVAGLAGSGTYWLIQYHPSFKPGVALQHLILPALTVLVIGVPLNNIPFEPLWWVIFVLGGLVLLAVLTAEYITINPEDIRQPAAAGVLTALSFALYLILAIGLRASNVRLFLLLPPLFIAGSLVSLRTMHLRLQGGWLVAQSIGVGLILSQMAAGLHYLPVPPVTFGLYLFGLAYALTIFFSNLTREGDLAQAATEPIVVLVITLIMGLWIQ